MKTGYIYILSNDSLRTGLLKIGHTQTDPIKRAKNLSRSTAVPGNFKVEYSCHVKDSRTTERRVHLLLDPHRFNVQKEFFAVDLQKAKRVVKKVAAYCNADYLFGDEVTLHHELIEVMYSKKMGLRQLQLLRLMMSQSHNNTIIDHLQNLPQGIVSGFLAPVTFANWLSISSSSARDHYRKFAREYDCLRVTIRHSSTTFPLFDFLRYSKGELAWTFSDEARQRFISQMVEKVSSPVE